MRHSHKRPTAAEIRAFLRTPQSKQPPRFKIDLVTDIGKMLVFAGLLIVAGGAVLMLLGRTNLPIGRLPGDILYRGKHTTFYFPLATSILVSVVLSLVLYFLGRIRR